LCVKAPRLNRARTGKTAPLEAGRGVRNSGCSGEMRRDPEEHQWRRRYAGPGLTLRRESMGSERD
jgi:hypothetical protein